MNARPRRRLPTRPHQLKNIRLSKRGSQRFKSKKQEITVKVLQAIEQGKRHVFLDMRGKKAVYSIRGRGRRNVAMRMVYNLTKKSVDIPKNPTIGPSALQAGRLMPTFYEKALKFQLERLGLFKD